MILLKKWGELGPIYGKQWRDVNGIDQLENLIVGLINEPNSRRHIVNSWNVSELEFNDFTSLPL
jgi:thymidylate synthase